MRNVVHRWSAEQMSEIASLLKEMAQTLGNERRVLGDQESERDGDE